MVAIGLATPLPAMSGAEPCTGSYSARRCPRASAAPSEAEGSMPSEPVTMAASSDSMSPNRLSVTITSNCFGCAHELHGAIVGEDVVQRHVAVALLVQRA